jgi:SPP1 gp7 family putative phage head morphogenesis protein
MTESMKEMEKNLTRIEKQYMETYLQIVKKLKSFYKQYETSPESVKQYQLQNIMRLEKIALQIQNRLDKLGIEFTDFLKGSLKEDFVKAVNEQVLAMNTVNGTTVQPENLSMLNTTAVELAVMYGYAGYNFEVDFNGRTRKFGNLVNEIIANGIAQGDGIREISKKLKEEMGTHIFHAKRIARTETSRILNDASKKVYKEMGVEKLQWLDSTEQVAIYNRKGKRQKGLVCSRCRARANGGEKNNGVYPIDSVPPLPAHPQCRCTIAPYYED